MKIPATLDYQLPSLLDFYRDNPQPRAPYRAPVTTAQLAGEIKDLTDRILSDVQQLRATRIELEIFP